MNPSAGLEDLDVYTCICWECFPTVCLYCIFSFADHEEGAERYDRDRGEHDQPYLHRAQQPYRHSALVSRYPRR